MTYHCPRKPVRPRQKGVVLALALILLTVVSLVAIYTLRGTITGEQVSKNLRTNAVATQAAETALRICEDAVRTSQSTLGTGTSAVAFTILDVPESMDADLPNQWSTRANWVVTGSAKTANQIPVELITDANMRPIPAPRCMVERYQLPFMGEDKTMSQPVLITAIGYTPDYQVNSSGAAVAGGEVWLQSIFRP
ncbi:hypothetical protein J8G26_06505 [Acidovorax sp. JG5]|uniref:pilus assembly PilX family protein n=1 Tax=Acidovorax sp. JG5 TaxID=2822718 RepID=UPI001B3199FE|nr:PilX N-terminal domain-containing pilus assembly protein [Acidovorax sp. JG5]MBP3980382.1 hypothetical protein [Acidovorax sp. JG5]